MHRCEKGKEEQAGGLGLREVRTARKNSGLARGRARERIFSVLRAWLSVITEGSREALRCELCPVALSIAGLGEARFRRSLRPVPVCCVVGISETAVQPLFV